ncbi:MAG: ATP-dependent metallopeptidase FtsH/Yme1/Tma family protein [Deltaproteobacteria bacterium]|nr:MAG: ATP-dependent metallopeptidase FtsH/Yme1/Tma family protein [Deltaproteobacteria bacterium]
MLTVLLVWLWQETFDSLAVRTIPYSEFKARLKCGQVVEVLVGPDTIEGQIDPTRGDAECPALAAQTRSSDGADADAKSGSDAAGGTKTERPVPFPGAKEDRTDAPKGPFVFRTVRVEDPKLTEQLEAADVKFVGQRPRLLTHILLGWLLPIGFMLLLWGLLARRMAGAAGQALSFGKSRAKLVADQDTGVTFDDVAGAEEAKQDLAEVVEFLKHPDRYTRLGAKIPKGILLVGPPGTGKTLLARAVAGEAGVPFFHLSGSDFVEMFVGVGAARVRDLFEQAQKHAPCIVFIDEIDAIGRQRGVHMGVVNDEREQTLNQLLVELDGFEPNNGVIILAATNRPDVLDPALLRPGRFDRQVVLDAPDLDGREAILKVHARGKPLADDVDLRAIAKATPGMSGADLANAMNEAALLAARRGEERITQADIEAAVERIVAGPERKSRRLSEEDKRRVAYHETGHALVAHESPGADPVHKISIVPRGHAALGYTLQLPDQDQYLLTRTELEGKIRSLLGGRAAEEVVFGEVSSGAENDLERATTLARQMVTMFGMGRSVGLYHVGHQEGGAFLRGPYGPVLREVSDATAREVDQEVRELLERLYGEAKGILERRRNDLERIASHLLSAETLDRATFLELLGESDDEAGTRDGVGQEAAAPP